MPTIYILIAGHIFSFIIDFFNGLTLKKVIKLKLFFTSFPSSALVFVYMIVINMIIKHPERPLKLLSPTFLIDKAEPP